MTIRIIALTSLKEGSASALHDYLQIVGPLMAAAKANIVDRYEVQKNVVGTCSTQYITIVDYPDQAALDSVFQSPEYRSASKIKEMAFTEYHVCEIAVQE